MNATAKKIIEAEIEALRMKCLDLSEVFNTPLKRISCIFQSHDTIEGGWCENSIAVNNIHVDLFKQFLQSIFVHYDKEMRDLQTFLQEQTSPQPGPIVKTHFDTLAIPANTDTEAMPL